MGSPEPQATAPPRPLSAVLIAGLALLATLPVLLPGGEAYRDNAPHLAALEALARDALLGARSLSAWTEAAEVGFPAGELNAPAAWLPLAALVAAGMPSVWAWRLGVLVGNLVFAWGALRLGRRVWGDDRAAVLGAGLALLDISGLYGMGGSLGGMWPYRLGLGVMAAGLGSPGERAAGRNAAWLGALWLLHAWAGLLGLGWALVSGSTAWLRDDRAGARAWAVGGVVAVPLTARWWGPILDSGTRSFTAEPMFQPAQVLALALLPLQTAVTAEQSLEWIAGGIGAVVALAVAAGLWMGRERWWRALRGDVQDPPEPLTGRLLVACAVVVALVAFAGLSQTQRLGPIPWRYLAVCHLVFAVLGGGALGARLGRLGRALTLVAALGASWGAARLELPPRVWVNQEWEDLEATWRDLAEAQPEGRVFHEDASFDLQAPAAWRATHVGALLPTRTGLPVLGSWYTITPSPTTTWTTSEGPATMGGWPRPIAEFADPLYARLRLFGVGALVALSPELTALLESDPRYEEVARHGAVSAWRMVEPPLPRLRGAAGAEASPQQVAPGRIVGEVGAGPFTISSSWHPGWRASLDGEPVALRPDPGSGLMLGAAPRAGTLTVAWTSGEGPWWWLTLLGVVGVAAAGWRPIPAAASPVRWTPGKVAGGVLLVHLALTALCAPRAPLLLDDIGQQLATRAIVDGTGLFVDVGNDLPLAELASAAPGFSAQVTEHAGRLVVQYPPGFGVLAAPFYAVAGYAGLWVVNGLSLVFCVWATGVLARRWGAPAVPAQVILVLGSYFWEYGLWTSPHSAALAFLMGAMLLAGRPEGETAGANTRREVGRAALAGACLGGSLLLRLDAVFLAPAVLAVVLTTNRARGLPHSAALALGALPPVALLSYANHLRFNTWNPLSYGVSTSSGLIANTSSAAHHLPSLAAGLAAVAGVAALVEKGTVRRLLAAAAAVALLAHPAARAAGGELVLGFARIVVDLRWIELTEAEPASARLGDGTMVYFGLPKKALLQSCPWILALVLPLGVALRAGLLQAATPAWIAIAGPVGFFAATAWHGGLGLNLRYLLPVLPFAAIELARMLQVLPRNRWWGAGAGVGLLAGLAAIAEPLLAADAATSRQILLSTVMIGLVAVGVLLRGGWLGPALTAALTWSGTVAFGADLRGHTQQREVFAHISQMMDPHVPPGALLVVPFPDLVAVLHDRRDIRIANTFADGGAGFPALVEAARKANVPIYLIAGDPKLPSAYPIRPPAKLVVMAWPYRLLKLDDPP